MLPPGFSCQTARLPIPELSLVKFRVSELSLFGVIWVGCSEKWSENDLEYEKNLKTHSMHLFLYGILDHLVQVVSFNFFSASRSCLRILFSNHLDLEKFFRTFWYTVVESFLAKPLLRYQKGFQALSRYAFIIIRNGSCEWKVWTGCGLSSSPEFYII